MMTQETALNWPAWIPPHRLAFAPWLQELILAAKLKAHDTMPNFAVWDRQRRAKTEGPAPDEDLAAACDADLLFSIDHRWMLTELGHLVLYGEMPRGKASRLAALRERARRVAEHVVGYGWSIEVLDELVREEAAILRLWSAHDSHAIALPYTAGMSRRDVDVLLGRVDLLVFEGHFGSGDDGLHNLRSMFPAAADRFMTDWTFEERLQAWARASFEHDAKTMPIDPGTPTPAPTPVLVGSTRPRAFLSSPIQGLTAERDIIAQALTAEGFDVVRWEAGREGATGLAGDTRPPEPAYLEGVRTSDATVVLASWRHGVVGPNGRTGTEDEYDEARRCNKPVLVLMDQRTSPDVEAGQLAFRKSLARNHSPAEFGCLESLAAITRDAGRRLAAQLSKRWIRLADAVVAPESVTRRSTASGVCVSVRISTSNQRTRDWFVKLDAAVQDGRSVVFVEQGAAHWAIIVSTEDSSTFPGMLQGTIELRLAPRPAAMNVNEYPRDISLGPDGDFEVERGDLKTVAGLEAFLQHLPRILLSPIGSWRMCPQLGTYLAALHRGYWCDPSTFELLARLETVRALTEPSADGERGLDEYVRAVGQVEFSNITKDGFRVALQVFVGGREEPISWTAQYKHADWSPEDA